MKIIKFLTKNIFNLPEIYVLSLRLSMLIFFFLLGIFTFAPRHLNIEPSLKPYIETIVHLSDGNIGSRIKRIGFVTENNSVLGRCYYATEVISINKKYWKDLSEKSKLLLLAHELIHCECKIGHIEGVHWDNCPVSIMSPTDGGEYCNKRYFLDYMEEMRTIRCK